MSTTKSFLLIVILAVLAAGWFLWPKAPAVGVVPPSRAKGDDSQQGESATSPDGSKRAAADLTPELESLRKNAFALQADRKWPDARDAWKQYLDKLPPDAKNERDEAKRNLELCEKQATKPVVEVTIPPPAEPDRPKEVPKPDVLAWYPPGRKVRSFAVTSVTGKGTSIAGILQKTAFFAYQYLIEAETTVLSNDGFEVEFEVHLKEVAQQMAADPQEELELKLPDSPLLDVVWEEAETYLRPIPAYRVFKSVVEAIETSDPHFKRALTKFHSWLKRRGLEPLGDDPAVVIAAKVDQLAGLRVKLKYISGRGVTHAAVCKGHVTDARALERIARNVSLFADYFVAEAAAKPKNAKFPLRCEDIAGLLAFGYDVEVSGGINLKKDGEKSVDGDKWTRLEVEGGEVSVDAPEREGARSGMFRPHPGGEVWYSPAQQLVRRAKVTWDVKTYWESRDSLLFGTTYEGDVQVQSDYWADKKK